MKNVKQLVFLLVLAFVLVLAACGGGNQSSSSSQGSNNSSNSGGQSSENVKPVTLKIASFVPPAHSQAAKVLEPFGQELEELTDGRVKAEYFFGGALGAPPAHYELAETGVADVSWGLQGYTEGKFRLSSVMELPFIGYSAQMGTDIFWELYEKFPEIQEEYKDTQVLWLFTNDPDFIFTTDKKVETLEDLKGLRIRTASSSQNAAVEAWGAVPNFMPMNEAYDAMQRGVVDGMSSPYSAVGNFQLYDVTGYITEGPFYVTNFFVTMNKDAFESLSAQDQEILMGLVDKYRDIAAQDYDAAGERGKALALEHNIEIIQLSDAETEKFQLALEGLYQSWIDRMESAGLPGQAVFDEAMRLSQEYNK